MRFRRTVLTLLAALAATAPAAWVHAAATYPRVSVLPKAARPTMRAQILAVNAWWVRTNASVPCDRCMVRPPGSNILWTFYEGQGFYPNWVRAAREVALRDRAGLRAGAAEILSDATLKRLKNGLRFRVMQSAYSAPDGTPPPWRDAMSNGLVLALIVPSLPPDPTQADLDGAEQTTREFLNAFGVRWTSGGLTERGSRGGLWYLEYADRWGVRSRVLNGFMQALVSLDQFSRQAGGLGKRDPRWLVLRDRARDYVTRGVAELVRALPRYDMGPGVSKYSLTRPGPAPKKYQVYHLQLLAQLEAMSYLPANARAAIKTYRRRWLGAPVYAPPSLKADRLLPPD